MSDELSFSKIAEADDAIMDVVFIHGLTGDPVDTWTSEEGGEYWPEWLCEKFPNIAVYTLGYPASLFAKWAKKEMDIFERATSAMDYMLAKGIGERPLVFITHSLGGILAKTMLRKSCDSDDENWKKISQLTRLVVFLATPHTGASLAAILKMVIPRFSSSHVHLLSNDTGVLDDIKSHYRSFAHGRENIKTVVYYEKYETNGVLVVSRESADPGVSGTTPVAADKDHNNICKPRDKNDPVYAGIENHVKQTLKSVQDELSVDNAAFGETEDYGSRDDHDRRNLLEKLTAAGREHEYEAANNYQNVFARNYLKLGLHTPAKEENNKILSEVEQRFITHIYHPLICKGGSDDEIRITLQSQVIDPICKKHADKKGFSEKTVLRALYFLTEQCNIRWDAPS